MNLSDFTPAQQRILLLRVLPILEERKRQDEKWGIQRHTLFEWQTILAEEVGELAAAILHHEWGSAHPELDWRKEASHVAAVALAMVELTEDKE